MEEPYQSLPHSLEVDNTSFFLTGEEKKVSREARGKEEVWCHKNTLLKNPLPSLGHHEIEKFSRLTLGSLLFSFSVFLVYSYSFNDHL